MNGNCVRIQWHANFKANVDLLIASPNLISIHFFTNATNVLIRINYNNVYIKNAATTIIKMMKNHTQIKDKLQWNK